MHHLSAIWEHISIIIDENFQLRKQFLWFCGRFYAKLLAVGSVMENSPFVTPTINSICSVLILFFVLNRFANTILIVLKKCLVDNLTYRHKSSKGAWCYGGLGEYVAKEGRGPVFPQDSSTPVPDAINFPPPTQTSCKHHHLSNTWIYECSPISTIKQETFWLCILKYLLSPFFVVK